jgi:hypothetical protein
LNWDQGLGDTNANYVSLVGFGSNSLATTFTLATGLTAGNSYYFRVRAKNLVGWGTTWSTSLLVIPSSVPDQVAVPVISTTGQYAKIAWSLPGHNGAAITAYKVVIQH